MTIGWLAGEAVRRYLRLHQNGHLSVANNSMPSLAPSGNNSPDPAEHVLEVRKTRGCVLLDSEDHVVDVLDDNDFVSIRLENDLPDAAVMSSFDEIKRFGSIRIPVTHLGDCWTDHGSF